MTLKTKTHKLKVYSPMRRATAGFGLVEILVALAVVILLWGGVKYLKQYQTESGKTVSGVQEIKRQAEAAKALIEARYASTTLGE